MMEIEKDEVFYMESGGGVTFSGGEPLMQHEALENLLRRCKKKGYHTAIDTSGHADFRALKKMMTLADLWLFDLKLLFDMKHVEYTGVSNELALSNLEALAASGKNIIIRFPLIPGITDGTDNIEGISALMNKLGLNRIDILPYHSIAREKYKRMGKPFLLGEVSEPDDTMINEMKDYFFKQGFEVGIGG
jgi:pyruvate formate lyase activating enzyme